MIARWGREYFSGQEYYPPKLPCEATQLGRFRTVVGESGVRTLLKATIDTAAQTKAVKPAEFKRVIVDTTVQQKAIAHPVPRYRFTDFSEFTVKVATSSTIAVKRGLYRVPSRLIGENIRVHFMIAWNALSVKHRSLRYPVYTRKHLKDAPDELITGM